MNDKTKGIITGILTLAIIFFGFRFYSMRINENRILKEVIGRLEADSRLAEVLVTGVNFDEKTSRVNTTIKFLEYDVRGRPLVPKYFDFSGNIIQFQSLVIRFDDINIRRGDRLRGKSVCVFWKIFMLDGNNTTEYEITKLNSIPDGYRIEGGKNPFEEKLWKKFWKYAVDKKAALSMGVRNAQIEAPGTIFIPGMLYTIKIEHDGGIRIDSSPLSYILRGEKVL